MRVLFGVLNWEKVIKKYLCRLRVNDLLCIFLLLLLETMLKVPVAAQMPDADWKLVHGYLDRAESTWAGELSAKFVRWGPDYRERGSIEAGFDHSRASLYFFQEFEQGHPAIDLSFKLAVNRENSIYSNKKSTIVKDLPEKLRPNVYKNAFDWRCIGICNAGEWDRRLSFEKIVEYLNKESHEVSVERLDHQKIAISWQSEIESGEKAIAVARRRIVFDEKKGGVPVEMMETMWPIGTPLDKPGMTEFAGTVEWKQIQGEWVPTHWVYEGSGGVVGGEVTLHWESVNNPVPREKFTLAALKPAPGTFVVNERLDPPVIEQVIGEDQRNDIQDKQRPFFSGRRVFIGLSLITLGALFVWLKFRQSGN